VTTRIRALIADDEPIARDRLRGFLQTEPDIEIVAECGSGPEAVAAIRQARPDLVFLDVEMPGCDGLEVIARLPAENRPAIVFVTAHEDFALEAFDVQAIDYLLKPFDRERLQTALRRAQEHLQARRTGELKQQLATLLADAAVVPEKKPARLTVKADGRLVFVKPDDIVWVEAADNYVVLHLREGRLMLRETLTTLETRLDPDNFTRINRSALVHLDQVRELQPTFHGDYVVLLRDGTKLPLSRSLRGRLGRFTGDRLD
jgi:two-component system LytT family response regulator